MAPDRIQTDQRVICDWTRQGEKVLDLGCGSGDLLAYLVEKKHVYAQGVEISDEAIYRCVEKGISVFHGDIESGLSDYPDGAFDLVILNQTLQECRRVEFVLQEALRVGKRVIVGFPNFAHFKSRAMLFFEGRSPITKSLPYRWNDTPNLHFLSLKDFEEYCKKKGIGILACSGLTSSGVVRFLANWRAENALFLISKQ